MQRTAGDDTIVVVGGGLCGLTAAAFLARSGCAVTVLERASAPGGRAVTRRSAGFALNLGPHALYRGGHGVRVLDELGVAHPGGTPRASGGCALDRGAAHALPGGFVSLLTTGLFGLSAKLETGRLLGGFARIDADALDHVSVRDWADAHIRHPDVRRLVHALVRLATYADAPDTMSAGLAIRQIQMALASNVSYLDGGWQTLVDGMRARAEEAGARVRTAAAVTAVERGADGAATGVRLRDGELVGARAVVLALDAAAAAEVLPDGPARRRAATAVPVLAGCLDVALSRLPRPQATFALGIDQPLYFSVHSAVARLAPEGGALIHVGQYLGGGGQEPKMVERQLEDALERMQPGWRAHVVEQRFLPRMVAVSALATAAEGGLSGRPGAEVAEVPGLYLAGDWVGPDGWLVDASLASGRHAAQLAARRVGRQAAAAA
jgi:phytoene dehydrogenase-like protein